MIVDGTERGDQWARETEFSFEEFQEYSSSMHDLGRGRSQDDFQSLACSGDTVKDGIEAVREGMRQYLLAHGFTEVEAVRFTPEERRSIEECRVSAMEADELPPPRLREYTFPGEEQD